MNSEFRPFLTSLSSFVSRECASITLWY